MLRVIGAVPLFGCAFRLGLLVSVTVALGCDGKPNTQLTPPSQFGPAISSITPATGSTSGATVVTIVGLRFQAGATVTFGGATATVSSLSSTSITATTEGRTPGTVDVVVTNPDGQATTAAGRFTFTPPPFAASVYPHTGSTGGRTVPSRVCRKALWRNAPAGRLTTLLLTRPDTTPSRETRRAADARRSSATRSARRRRAEEDRDGRRLGAERGLGLRAPAEFAVEILERVRRPQRLPHRLRERGRT